MATQQTSIVLTGIKTLAAITSPIHAPSTDEVLIKVLYTASTPLDLHRSDGGLLVGEYPALTGSGGVSGTIAAVGESLSHPLQVGDRVSSFAFHGGKEANHQEYITVPSYLVSKLPDSISLEQAATVPVNLVTVFHTVTRDLELDLPWPKPQGYKPRHAKSPILIWGASSSVGIFAIQVLRHWGYDNLVAVSSAKHHQYLKSLGAAATFDYTNGDGVTDEILQTVGLPTHIIDCIGSVQGTLIPLTRLAASGTIVAVMLPVIVRDASDTQAPEYEMDVANAPVQWAPGVIVRGVRTHFYLEVSIRFQPL